MSAALITFAVLLAFVLGYLRGFRVGRAVGHQHRYPSEDDV